MKIKDTVQLHILVSRADQYELNIIQCYKKEKKNKVQTHIGRSLALIVAHFHCGVVLLSL